MHEVQRSAIVPYTSAQMFELVADVERYPEFLPWCVEGQLLWRNDSELSGRLGLALGPLRGRFTTRNQLDPPHHMTLQLVDGPFSELDGDWRFEALGDEGCRISLRMRFEFSNPVKDRLLGSVFEKACNTLVDAFVARAAVVYG